MDSAGNVMSTWCTAFLVYLLQAFSALDAACDVHMAETEWVGPDAACNVLMVIHMPQGKSYLDIALSSTAWLSELI